MTKLTKEDIKVGMLVQLNGIVDTLIVAEDNLGEEEYEDNEISYSYALQAARQGILFKL